MRKIYILTAIAVFSINGLRAQTCTNAPNPSVCTGGNVTADFAEGNENFTGTSWTYNAAGDYLNVDPATRNSAYTVTSGVFLQNTTGGNIGFTTTGTTSNITSVGIQVIDASTNAVLFSCTRTLASQVCVQYSVPAGAVGTNVRYRFTFTTANGASGDGLIVFDNFANGGSAAPLPVKLDNFEAAKEGSGIKLTWKTEHENGVARYEIQRSSDGANFQTIGTVAAANKTNYNYVDALPTSANNFYRLRIVDVDNVTKISHIVSIKSKVGLNIEAYPNPVRDRMIVQHPKAITGSRMQIVNMNGQVVKDVQLPANAVVTPLDVTGLKNGTYYIVFRSGAESFSQRITKQ
ncbi:MAG TPA: T9SS type A sorting domain-containing protein [Chitinophagaceae bacterium]|nr:T9SS type A sorting domain-containing protein [Chitinophagaceae bacterium]